MEQGKAGGFAPRNSHDAPSLFQRLPSRYVKQETHGKNTGIE